MDTKDKAAHPHLEGLIRLRERIRMASIMACGGIPNVEAGGWSDELREIIQALAALPGGGVDEAMVTRAARALCRRQADECNVDYDDTWKVYGDSFIDDARAALTAALSPTPNPHEADRNG